jgi:hypothetical protein
MDIYYLVAQTPSLLPPLLPPFNSTQFNSIFSFIYFGRAIFRGLGNIVGFGNSSNSPRNYSPVRKSLIG